MDRSTTRCAASLRAMWHRVMIPAYDDPLLWEGHASMVEEVHRQLPKGAKPDAIVCSVGGGGLAGGIIEGCKAVGWDDGKCLFMDYNGDPHLGFKRQFHW